MKSRFLCFNQSEAIQKLLIGLGVVLFLSTTGSVTVMANDAAEYESCIKLTKREPEMAFESALSWRDQGGGFPARHCAALALVGMKKYHLAAPRLEKLAHEMQQAGSDFVIPILSQAANAWLLAEDYPRANAVASAALELEPGNIELLIDRSHILAKAKNYQEAYDDLDLALRLDPTRPDALAYRGATLRQLGDNKRALEDIELALSLQPDLTDALIERGILRRLTGDNDGARQDWLKVLSLSPHSPAGDTARKNIEKLDVQQ
ncbi:tetratricopeptide repeat protein [Sneathiella sp.]|jgi:tetratricopeptide (TPR) repeat protein|uniref:tetratricopeptide repeat protein n=1 Tax=Sneathiella sp. TaxID=1964365 RepID=UPI0039E6949B